MRRYLEQTVALCDHVSEALRRRQVLVQVLLVRSARGVLLLHGPGDKQANLHLDVPSSASTFTSTAKPRAKPVVINILLIAVYMTTKVTGLGSAEDKSNHSVSSHLKVNESMFSSYCIDSHASRFCNVEDNRKQNDCLQNLTVHNSYSLSFITVAVLSFCTFCPFFITPKVRPLPQIHVVLNHSYSLKGKLPKHIRE